MLVGAGAKVLGPFRVGDNARVAAGAVVLDLSLIHIYFRLNPEIAKRLLGLGTPVAAQNVIIAVGGMVVQSVVNRYGTLFVAGFTATNKLYGILEIAAVSFGYAVTTYVGQNLGAGLRCV